MSGPVVAVSLCKDELDALGFVRHTLDEVDAMIVADNGSTDGTREALAALEDEFSGRLVVEDDPDPAYFQSLKTSRLAQRAQELFGAEWVAPLDFDEIVYSRDGRLREILPGLPWNVVKIPIFNHICTALDKAGDDPFRTMVWRQAQAQQPLGKVAFRFQEDAVIWQGNHGVTLPDPGPYGVLTEPLVELRHFPNRSPAHMVRKARNGAAAYAAARAADPDMPADWGLHWTQWGALLEAGGEEAIADAFRLHWWRLVPYLHDLVEDPAPYLRWQTPETGQPADGHLGWAGDGSP